MNDHDSAGTPTNPIPLTSRVANPLPQAESRPGGFSMWEQRREDFKRIATAIAQGLIMHGGPNLPSATLVAKTMEYTNALDAEINKQLAGRNF